MSTYRTTITAQPDDIDVLGHVNNAVWVRWVQEVAVAHWEAIAPASYQASSLWVVTRHEIDYRGNVVAGETVVAETWINEPPRGARFDRRMRFLGIDDKVRVEAKTTWAMIDRQTGRLMRVPSEIAALFLHVEPVAETER